MKKRFLIFALAGLLVGMLISGNLVSVLAEVVPSNNDANEAETLLLNTPVSGNSMNATTWWPVSSAEGEGEPVEGEIVEGEGESVEGEGEIEPGEEVEFLLPNGVLLVMIKIPAGTFMMGRYDSEQDSFANEYPQHQVTLSQDFYMGKYEVTKRQWIAVMGTMPWLSQMFVLNDLDSPAVYVLWDDAQSFITALNTYISNTSQGTATFRLPTEAEWEYACRAGTTTRFYWGDDSDYTVISNYAWHYYNASNAGERYAHVVGLKLPNAFGLYDMSGNVYEWCGDWNGDYPSDPVTDPTGPSTGPYRLYRGGTYSDSPMNCRSAFRGTAYPSGAPYAIGFRLVCTP